MTGAIFKTLYMNSEIDFFVNTHLKIIIILNIMSNFLGADKALRVILLNLVIQEQIIGPLDHAVNHTLGKILQMSDKTIVRNAIFCNYLTKV